MRALALTAALLLASGCGPKAPGSDGGESITCDAYTAGLSVLEPDGKYAPLEGSPEAELVLGFQGFQMVFVEVRVSRVPPITGGAIVVQLDGGHASSQAFAELAPRDDGAGGYVTEPFPIFFNANTLVDLANQRCALILELGRSGCSARAAGHVTLIYQQGCFQSTDGAIACPDGGAR